MKAVLKTENLRLLSHVYAFTALILAVSHGHHLLTIALAILYFIDWRYIPKLAPSMSEEVISPESTHSDVRRFEAPTRAEGPSVFNDLTRVEEPQFDEEEVEQMPGLAPGHSRTLDRTSEGLPILRVADLKGSQLTTPELTHKGESNDPWAEAMQSVRTGEYGPGFRLPMGSRSLTDSDKTPVDGLPVHLRPTFKPEDS